MFRYYLSEPQSKLRYLYVAYKNEPVLKFSTGQFFKPKTDPETIFIHINSYLNQMDEDRQQRFYEYLLEFKNQIKHYGERNYITNTQELIRNITNLIDYHGFINWYVANAKCIIPDTVKPGYEVDVDLNTTREKTYILDEYLRLLGLVEFLRMLSPFTAEFYTYYRQAGGNHNYRVLMLYIQTVMYEGPEMEKLREYLSVNQNSGSAIDSELIFDLGLSTDDFLDNVIAEILVSKLMSIDFINKEKFNAITYVFRTLRNKGTRYGSNSIRATSARRNSKDEDYSYFEEQRKTSDITHGNIVELQYALTDHETILKTLKIDKFNKSAYLRELKLAMEYVNTGDITLYITRSHTILLGWCLAKYINPRALNYVSHSVIVELLVLFKFIAVDKGFPYIGLFLNAYIDDESDYVLPSSNTSIDKATAEELAKHYQYVSNEGRATPIEKTIVDLSRRINRSMYIPLNTNDKLQEHITADGLLIPVSDLSQRLMLFVKEFIT